MRQLLLIASDLGFLARGDVDDHIDELERIGRQLWSLIRRVTRSRT